MASLLTDDDWNLLLTDAHTHHGWTDRPVERATLEKLYQLLRMAPTAMNCQPLRVVFVQSAEAKARLRPSLEAGNVDKTMAAPVTAIVACDTQFYAHMDRLAPHIAGIGARMAAMPEAGRDSLIRNNATLQTGYLILTARGLGLDCGPMGGFDRAKVDAEFFADGRYKSLLLVNLGYGDPSKLRPRAPRLDFDEACRVE